jgi:hypothetical protein
MTRLPAAIGDLFDFGRARRRRLAAEAATV